ncbi:Carboxymethylenebutenolidase [Achromobacter deleyi]|uniref:Carboxymethylenebutenolidase n=1 Tax=Achromobacter deleyi TaxID=1353891 RepID=A0A6S7A1F8_9BURK|nr:dienelactone hydrolase family protein [Achromobacter deleyi]CAB3707661.1 Carboxymethylenebutenolidase [Achromobacter deleyi]CAB3865717.1 Carboxymethylenebutenolidase [Achromobacter deleyi]CAB3878526.1 Carboxymethylenebutenolidase [Achromobacter deleyi]
MHSRYEPIAAGDGRTFSAYVAEPAHANGHAVIILQEIFGVTDTIRALADRYAAEGYLALAPDLFWRLEPGVELPHDKAGVAKAFEYLERFDEDTGIDDIGRTVAQVRARPDFAGKVAVLGLCLGGKLAFRAAATLDIDAAVTFYGVGVEAHLDEADRLACPLMLHYGGRDRYAPPAAVDQIEAALPPAPLAVLHRYPEADHGFYTRGGGMDADIAHERTQRFLQQALGAAS